MTFTIVGEPAAVDLAAGFLADDAEELRQVFTIIDALAAEPRPPCAFPLGSPTLQRLRVGGYRVVYEIDDAARIVRIRHVGRRT